MWTLFWDMHSGGDTKEEPYDKIYIEAPQKRAKIIFYNRFGHNPERITCTCCGEDYSISESRTLTQASAYHRGCHFDEKKKRYVDRAAKDRIGLNEYMKLKDYINKDTVLVIQKADVEKGEDQGNVPGQGFVWVD